MISYAAAAPCEIRRRNCRDRVCVHCGNLLPGPEPDEVLIVGDLRLDVPRRYLTVGGESAQWGFHPSIQPILMLAELMRFPGRVWHVERLMQALGMWEVQSSSVKQLACRIRRAIKPSERTYLATVRGVGYVLEVEL